LHGFSYLIITHTNQNTQMKTLKTAAIALGLFGLLAGSNSIVRAQGYSDDYQDEYYNDSNVSLQTFYDELSPYGTWIQDPQYGYVWRPDVDQSDFRPYYTNGRWVMTEYGNTWVSNYNWGWGPFHYGRWVYNSYRQWVWMPDTTWGPAWVDWRSGDGYYGWAPMAPSININISFGRRYAVPEFCWNFIPQANIYVNTFPRYDYGRNNVYYRNTTIINNTYIYNNRSYYGGPRREDIRRATNRDVRVYRVSESNRPGVGRVDSRQVSIYRPRPERNVDNRSAAPKNFERGNAGFGRGNNTVRDNGNAGNTNSGQRNNGQPQRGDANMNRGNTNPQTNRGEVYNRDVNGSRPSRNSNEQRQNGLENQQRAQADQQRAQRNEQMQQQRNQQVEQQRNQQQQQQRAQADQQRAQRNEQMQQQRQQQAEQQRNQQQQQQRAQADQQRAQADQQRAQRNEQMQQQRQQQAQQQQQQRQQADQQRAQRNEQMQQQRQQQVQQQQQQRQQAEQQRSQQQQQQQRSSESGRPSRGGRG